MLTYDLDGARGELGRSLYAHIRADILSGALRSGDRLPSKRELSDHLQISKTTVESAYYQLATEGYIRAETRRGYFVEEVDTARAALAPPASRPVRAPAEGRRWRADLTGSTVESDLFPFSVWARLTRRELTEHSREILETVPANGTAPLRRAVSDYLYRSRGMSAPPDNIVIGAGTEYLYGIIIKLLGLDLTYAVEEPGYQKIRQIYSANGVRCAGIATDGGGMDVEALRRSGAQAVHLSPSHNFPTGVVTPVRRRQELLRWAGEGRYVIEDDYDCEFRMAGRPLPALQSIDTHGRVIYVNTFSKTLAPSMRISYMVLPEELMARFWRNLGFYSCAVCGFEQYTLASFLDEGHFERHVSRMKKHYRSVRDELLEAVAPFAADGRVTVGEKEAGLHFLMTVNSPLSPEKIRAAFDESGVGVSFLDGYFRGRAPVRAARTAVMNYSSLARGSAGAVAEALGRCF